MSSLQWREYRVNGHRGECGPCVATVTVRPDGKYDAILTRDQRVMASGTVATIDEGKLWCEAFFVQECVDQLEEDGNE
jgi:hypothetical protein